MNKYLAILAIRSLSALSINALLIYIVMFSVIFSGCKVKLEKKKNHLNIVLLTLDDMGFGTTGIEGCKMQGITPNINKLANEGILFTHGFVMSPICGPSRSAILSGRYPHCNGVMGHGKQPPPLWQEPDIITPTITKYLHDHGYTTGAILKNRRAINNVWDVKYQEFPFGVGFHDRNPDSFYKRTKAFIEESMKKNKPYFLYANPIDPHRPWVDTEQEKNMLNKWNVANKYPAPLRRYKPEEVEVPSFLPDLPEIRKNLVPYYESLNRGDECIGAILKAIEESTTVENTMIIFLSDNGMGAIGAKATLYHHGLRTPVIIKWPGKIKRGIIDRESIISSIDIMPTIIEAINLPKIEGIEGVSFMPILQGKDDSTKREYAYAASNYFANSSPEHFLPQRAIIDKSYCYIWNSYVVRSNGKKKINKNWIDVVQPCLTKDNPMLVKKIQKIIDKPVEEFFDLENDPGCWNNLANDPNYKSIIKKYRQKLLLEMKSTNDPELPIFKF